MSQIIQSTGIDPKILPVPIPVAYDTFDKHQKLQKLLSKEKSTKKTLGFGVGPRLPLNEEEIKKRRASLLKNTDHPIDMKKDLTPGPMGYSLIAHWPGKKQKNRNGEVKEQKKNLLNCISRGPSINPYYSSCTSGFKY